MEKASKLEVLRTIVEKVERRADLPPDNPDVIALKTIVDHKIEDLETAGAFAPSLGNCSES